MSKRKEKSKHDIWQNIEYWIKKYPNKTVKECGEMLDQKKKSATKKRPDNTGIPVHSAAASQGRHAYLPNFAYTVRKPPFGCLH